MAWIEANGISHRYLIEGDGPLLVLVHEMGGTLESWDKVAPTLAASGHTVLRYDLRNAGLSEKTVEPFGFPNLAADLSALVTTLGLPPALVVSGCAFGGAVALCLAARFPHQTQSVLAISPAVGVPLERREAVLSRAQAMRRENLRLTQDQRLAAPWPEEFRGNGRDYHNLWLMRVAGDPFVTARQLEVLAAADMDEDLASIACPVTVLAGRQDRERQVETVAATARRIGSGRVDFREIESGHFMPLQSPALVVDAFHRHIAALTEKR